MCAAPLQLFVIDIDGCLTHGGGEPFYLRSIEYLREVNELAPRFEAVPETTFLTGRPVAYMECLMQAINCRMPGLSENGALMFRLTDRFEAFHPALPEDALGRLLELTERAREELLGLGDVIELGKTASLAIVPGRGRPLTELRERAQWLIEAWGDTFELAESSGILHVLFRGVTKGSSVAWLSDVTGVPTERMAGIGDAVLDVPFLRAVGFSAAPVQAPEYVREAVTFRAPGGPGQCIVETLDRIIERNLRAAVPDEAEELRTTLREIHAAVFDEA